MTDMPYEYQSFERESLYEEVWSEAVIAERPISSYASQILGGCFHRLWRLFRWSQKSQAVGPFTTHSEGSEMYKLRISDKLTEEVDCIHA
jgi:hypothetical protein